MHFLKIPHDEIKCVLSIEGSNFDEKNGTKFSHLPMVGAEGLTVSLTVKRAFLTTPLLGESRKTTMMQLMLISVSLMLLLI